MDLGAGSWELGAGTWENWGELDIQIFRNAVGELHVGELDQWENEDLYVGLLNRAEVATRALQ